MYLEDKLMIHMISSSLGDLFIDSWNKGIAFNKIFSFTKLNVFLSYLFKISNPSSLFFYL